MNLFTLPLAILGLGQGEIIVILLVLLLLFGGKKLPELARGLGKSIREFKRATSDVEEDLRRAIDEEPSKPVAPPPRADKEPTQPPAASS